jgi:predicted dehydrogenase
MRLRTYPGERSWHEPFATVTEAVEPADPLAAQIAHFAAVVRGEAKPLCSGRDGLTTLRVVAAVAESARTGAPVDLR